MSQQNVEIVRESFLASGSGDPGAASRYFDEALEWDMSGVVGWAEKDVYRGQPEVQEFLQAWADSWGGTWRYDVEEVLDAGEDQVFVAIHEWGTGAESGASVDQRRYFAATLREGQIGRVRMFSERPDALKALGLSE